LKPHSRKHTAQPITGRVREQLSRLFQAPWRGPSVQPLSGNKNMNKFWKFYFVVFSLYEIAYLIGVYTSSDYSFHVKYILHVFLWLGLFGYVFSKNIFRPILWKILLFLTCLNYIYFWVVVAVGAHITFGTSYIILVKYLAWEFHIIPLFYTTYLYAWKSNNIWKSAT
jgi:hypothetical protein